MGNMLESDSSSSDIENVEAPEIIRTEGDGMEFVKDSVVESNVNMISKSLSSTGGNPSNFGGTELIEKGAIKTAKTNGGVNVDESQGNPSGSNIFSRSPSIVSSDSKNLNQSFKQADVRRTVASSPNQLPARDLLIPVKAVKCETKVGKKSSSTSSGADNDKSPTGVNKQKNAKFVPYEPYTCAVRPMVPAMTKHRKSSESSSVASSVQSSRNATPLPERRSESIGIDPKLSPRAELATYNSNYTTNERSPSSSSAAAAAQVNNANIANNQHNNHSSVLLRERLKIAEKEILDLQSENAKLKKLLLDSMTVPNNSNNTNFTNNGNSNHDHKESFDNLNDEIEVWRSKFLSSCVLVEQLTRDNQMLNESINFACEVLQDLKNTLPLTPLQYELVSEWLRKNRFMSTSFGSSSRQSSDTPSEPKQD